MRPQVRLGDRREHLRFEVAGQLWASVDLGERVVLRNLATGGALIETSLTSALKPIRAAQIALDEHGPELNVIVRHVSPTAASPTGDGRYLVGLEFVNVSPTQRVGLERLVRAWAHRTNA